MTTIQLDGRRLTIDAVTAIARDHATVELSDSARQRVADGEAYLERLIADGGPVYGVTTGFGALDERAVSRRRNEAQQHNLLKSHAAGVGAGARRAGRRLRSCECYGMSGACLARLGGRPYNAKRSNPGRQS